MQAKLIQKTRYHDSSIGISVSTSSSGLLDSQTHAIRTDGPSFKKSCRHPSLAFHPNCGLQRFKPRPKITIATLRHCDTVKLGTNNNTIVLYFQQTGVSIFMDPWGKLGENCCAFESCVLVCTPIFCPASLCYQKDGRESQVRNSEA